MVKNEMRERIKKIKIREKNERNKSEYKFDAGCGATVTNAPKSLNQRVCAHSHSHRETRVSTHKQFLFVLFGVWMLFWCVSSSSHC